MHRVNLLALCERYAEIRDLDLNAPKDPWRNATRVVAALHSVARLLESTDFPLRLTILDAEILKTALFDFYGTHFLGADMIARTEPGAVVPEEEVRAIERLKTLMKKFLDTLAIELQDFHIYLVPDIGLYNVNSLLDAGLRAFPPETLEILPSAAVADIQHAGKCLAFNLNTACGFHSLRAAETVIKQYMLSVGCSKEEVKKAPSWYAYGEALKKHNAEKRIIALIDIVRNNHRNPIMHPEQTLDSNQADALFTICRTLIQSIADETPSTEAPLAVG